jgi:hypothetical protein
MNSKICSILAVALFSAAILLPAGCSKSTDNPVPSVYVDFTIYLSQPSNASLNAVGGWNYYTGGARGIIVYRLNIDTFMAFDRNCTYNPNLASAVVSVDSSGLMASDASCGSRFVLIDGSVSQGPATIGLRQYHADFDGLNTVHVYSN